MMAKTIFTSLVEDKENREELINTLMNEIKIDNNEEKTIKKEISRLINLYLDKVTDVSYYETFQKKLTNKIEGYKLQIGELEKRLENLDPPEVKMEQAKQSIRKLLDINYNGIDEKLIEEVVEKIIVHKNWFEWKLNFLNETIKLEFVGKRKNDCMLVEHK